MSDQAMQRIRCANPFPNQLPALPIEEIWQRVDAGSSASRLGHGLGARRLLRARFPGAGALLFGVSVGVTVTVAVLAIALLGHHHVNAGGISRQSTTGGTQTGFATGTVSLGAAIDSRSASQGISPGAPTGTVRIVAQSPDPAGGLSWGVRAFETTEGQTCVQLGRVQNGLIGVIGQDGAWADDHRFHPIEPNASRADFCSETDGNGNAFENVIQPSLSTSAATVWELSARGGMSGHSLGCGLNGSHDPCRKADLRIVQYGLLGPDATSIAYLNARGEQATKLTSGSDGAYLIVDPASARLCRVMWNQSGCGRQAPGGYASDPRLQAGLITAVRYRDGHICHVPPAPPAGSLAGTPQGSCPDVGYVEPAAARQIRPAQVTAPVTARTDASKHLVEITFIARVAVTNPNSYYQYTLQSNGSASASCADTTGDTTANTRTRAGQRVVFKIPIKPKCTGTLNGTVAYVPNVGPAGSQYPMPAGAAGQARSIAVGRFTVVP